MRGGVAVGVWGEGLVVREGVGVGVGPGVALRDRSAFSRSLVSFLASVTEKKQTVHDIAGNILRKQSSPF